mmetsp:Transcript_91964/g.286680  ORF Transcript_91964/g.286680 Transcript_91964/m.286680 type:complete len:139 (-) Transcript_91964:54-470(-)
MFLGHSWFAMLLFIELVDVEDVRLMPGGAWLSRHVVSCKATVANRCWLLANTRVRFVQSAYFACCAACRVRFSKVPSLWCALALLGAATHVPNVCFYLWRRCGIGWLARCCCRCCCCCFFCFPARRAADGRSTDKKQL